MPNTTTQPYQGRVDEVTKMGIDSDRPTIIYFASVHGREEREKYEWSESDLDPSDIVSMFPRLMKSVRRGVYVAVAFPHITNLMGWRLEGGMTETNMYRFGLFDTLGLALPGRDGIVARNGAVFLGCPTELAIMQHEATLWSEARDVSEYLDHSRSHKDINVRSDLTEVTNHRKLAEFFEKS